MFNFDQQDELFELLTDALRSGPDSAEWARAVRALGGGAVSDEHNALLFARRKLEAARAYTRIKPSRQMTESVMAGVAAQAAAEERSNYSLRSGPRARTLAGLATAAALVILAVGALAVEWVLSDSGNSSVRLTLGNSGSAWSGRSQSFDSLVGPGWKPIGPLRIKAEKGLRLAGGMKHVDQSGGILRVAALPGKPFELTANVRYVGGSGVAPELFITDDADIDDTKPAEKVHQLVWTVTDDKAGVQLPDQSLPLLSDALAHGESATFDVKIKINGATATIEAVGGHRFYHWSGASMLDASKPLHAGVRFVVRNQQHDCAVVTSFCVHDK